MPAQDANTPTTITRVSYDRLRAELEDLTIDGRRNMAARLQTAREMGDLSENAEYHAAREEQAMMESRIRKIEHTLRIAQVTDEIPTADRATSGTFVTVRPNGGSEDEVYLLAGSAEERSDSAHTVTLTSPLGRALAGKAVGDAVEYKAPGGTFTYEVVKLEPWTGA